MPARACATTRSAAATCSSNASVSGSSALSRASQLATATSLSCRANNASRSGCTLPPCRLNDSIGRPLGIALGGESLLLMREVRFLVIAGEGDCTIDALDFAIEAACLESIHGALEHNVGLIGAEPFGLQCFVGARGSLVEPVRGVIGQGLEDRTVGGGFELLTVDGVPETGVPGLASHHELRGSVLDVGTTGG